jgi:hypothetical protein
MVKEDSVHLHKEKLLGLLERYALSLGNSSWCFEEYKCLYLGFKKKLQDWPAWPWRRTWFSWNHNIKNGEEHILAWPSTRPCIHPSFSFIYSVKPCEDHTHTLANNVEGNGRKKISTMGVKNINLGRSQVSRRG